MAHPVGLPVLHGYDPSPDWDTLLDCGCEPGDPHERLRWKHTREAFDSIKPFLKEREEQWVVVLLSVPFSRLSLTTGVL